MKGIGFVYGSSMHDRFSSQIVVGSIVWKLNFCEVSDIGDAIWSSKIADEIGKVRFRMLKAINPFECESAVFEMIRDGLVDANSVPSQYGESCGV
jgi:hypothetical protein